MKSSRPGKPNTRALTLLWLVLFAAALAFSLWKLPYGFGGSDEGFYLTVAHRLSLGDSLFADEWHLSQLLSFFLWPFVKLYTSVTGSTEGIMLASRYLYLAMHALVSAVIYLRLRKFGLMAAIASVLYLIYTPFDMMTMSYNTIALDMLALTGVLLGAAGERDWLSWLLGGISFACAVVCCPYLALVYVVFALAAVAFIMPGLRKYAGFGFFTARNFRYLTLGILIPFALFVAFFFFHSDLSRLAANLPGILSDPEHPSYSLWFMAKHYVYCIVTAHRYILLPIGLYALHLLLVLLDKKRGTRRDLHFAFAMLCSALCLALFIPRLSEEYFNAVAFPMAFAGFTAYVLLEKKPVKLFISAFLLGICYSICVSSTSNMGFLVISMAFSVVNLASLVFIGLFVKENSAGGKRHTRSFAVAMLTLLFAAMLVYSKAEHCFWDGAPSQLRSEIASGPAKGIVTSAGLEESYRSIYEDMQGYKELERDELLVMSQIPWCYLIAEDYPYGSFSAWLSGLDGSTVERLELYYSANPQKIPQYIYIVKSNNFGPLFLQHDEIVDGAKTYGYSVEENDVSYKLQKLG